MCDKNIKNKNKIHPTAKIHPTSIINEDVFIGKDVVIGPYCIINNDVVIGDCVNLHSHVYIYSGVEIKNNCIVFPFVVLGGDPQDLKYENEQTIVLIDENTIIREGVTIHKGTAGGGGKTYIGKNCLIMGTTHIAHDCIISDNVVIAQNAIVGGHVEIGEKAIIGGMSAIHQHVRVGKGAIVGGGSVVHRDVIPYGNVYGQRSSLNGLNITGMKRSKISSSNIKNALELYNYLFKSSMSEKKVFYERLNEMSDKYDCGICREIISFLNQDSKRSICMDIENE